MENDGPKNPPKGANVGDYHKEKVKGGLQWFIFTKHGWERHGFAPNYRPMGEGNPAPGAKGKHRAKEFGFEK